MRKPNAAYPAIINSTSHIPGNKMSSSAEVMVAFTAECYARYQPNFGSGSRVPFFLHSFARPQTHHRMKWRRDRIGEPKKKDCQSFREPVPPSCPWD